MCIYRKIDRSLTLTEAAVKPMEQRREMKTEKGKVNV
jgi:hypothetical protein